MGFKSLQSSSYQVSSLTQAWFQNAARHDPVKQAAPYPTTQRTYGDSKREKMVIEKENNFSQVWQRHCVRQSDPWSRRFAAP